MASHSTSVQIRGLLFHNKNMAILVHVVLQGHWRISTTVPKQICIKEQSGKWLWKEQEWGGCFVQQLRCYLGCPYPISMPVFDFWLCSSLQLPINEHSWSILPVTHGGRTSQSPCLLNSSWSSPGCCGHLVEVNQWIEDVLISFSLSFSLLPSSFPPSLFLSLSSSAF